MRPKGLLGLGGCEDRAPGPPLPCCIRPQELATQQRSVPRVPFARNGSYLIFFFFFLNLKAAHLDAASGLFLHRSSRTPVVASNKGAAPFHSQRGLPRPGQVRREGSQTHLGHVNHLKPAQDPRELVRSHEGGPLDPH